MEGFLKPLEGASQMWVIFIVETLIVVVAMGVDFVSGWYKARLRGEERTSIGMKRTVGKFILYVGSLLIACGIDSIAHMCGFWSLFHVPFLASVPVVTSVAAVFVCAVEIRSVWEKAEKKQRKEALKTAEALVELLGKETVKKLF